MQVTPNSSKSQQPAGASQLDRATQVLVGLKADVTSKDRSEAIEKGIASKTTIWQYLNGAGKDLDIATELIRFFKGRIEARERIIA